MCDFHDLELQGLRQNIFNGVRVATQKVGNFYGKLVVQLLQIPFEIGVAIVATAELASFGLFYASIQVFTLTISGSVSLLVGISLGATALILATSIHLFICSLNNFISD